MKLYNADCLEVMRGMDDNSVDLIATDPPYFKVKGEAWDNQWDTADGFLAWLDTILEQFQRLLKPNGSLYLFASPKMAARVEVLISERFNVLNHITWQKDEPTHALKYGDDRFRQYVMKSERIIFAEHYGADNMAKGEAGYARKCDELRGFLFEPLRNWFIAEWDKAGLTRSQVDEACGTSNVTQYWFLERNYQIPTEDKYKVLQSLSNGSGSFKREYEDLKREYEDLRRPFSVSADVPFTDVWTFKTVGTYKGKHPCEKPAPMLEHIITASSKPGAVVLDAFMGTGSTGLACQKLDREFIGIEQNKKYYRQAEKRIREAQPALF